MTRISPIELAVMAVRRAIAEGATEAEAFVTHTRGYTVSMLAGRVNNVEYSDDIGVGVRAAVGRRLGFAYATGAGAEAAAEAARAAVKLARASVEDPYWSGLPEPSPSYPLVESIYEAGLARAGPETLLREARRLLSHIEGYRDEGVVLSRAGISVAAVERAVANSNGVYQVDSGTYASVLVSTSIVRGGLSTPAVFVYDSSRVAIPSVEAVADRAVELSRLTLRKAEQPEPGKYTVVYAPSAFAELLEETVLFSLRGDIEARGRSFFAGRLGEKVLDERITIIDDGALKGGDASWRFDGEGVASQRTVLVDHGTLRGFIYDTYWGRRRGVESTGNATRSGYASRPSVGFTNVIVEPGDASYEELLEGRVIVVYQVQGAHTASPETGEYSVLANPAVLYENGEPRGWLPGIVVGGNMYRDLEAGVEAVGKIVEKPYPGIQVPWVRLSGVTVAPKG